LGLGHRTVHYVSIPWSHRTSQRLDGWRSALEEAGAPAPEPVQAGWHPRTGYEAGRSLAADPAVTAVLCGNDDLALGVIRAMHEAGGRSRAASAWSASTTPRCRRTTRPP